ncbi:MAG TPA: hypothetical protein GXX24_00790 [Paracoccus solventivorans]|uniref:Uncharacterized protein n=1 Tax=Paracoccus solventivorans TaxID=53463 RepID=A0A832QTV3_9RHOB|nr:hypothetical protein [Paracoccus solventivorans]HHW32669.1 hypothetical protein [Paracoccus solventivorans]
MDLRDAVEVAADAMDRVLECFRPGCKITLLVRTPGHPSRDFCLTDDDLSEVAAMIERRRAESAAAAQISVKPMEAPQ